MLMAKRADVPGFVGTIYLGDMGTISRDTTTPQSGAQWFLVRPLLGHPIPQTNVTVMIALTPFDVVYCHFFFFLRYALDCFTP